jgi:hypothetical protein
MKKIFLAVTIFLSQIASAAGPIGTLGTLPSLTVGNQIFTDRLTNANFMMLFCSVGALTSCTFRTGNGGAGHQVAAGKTLYIYAYKVIFIEAATGSGNTGQLLYSSNDVGFNTSTAFSGAVYLNGNSTNGLGIFPYNAQGGASAEGPMNFQVPSGNYVGVYNNSGVGTTFEVFGYEM